MTGRSRVDECHGQLTAVPSADAVGIVQQTERDVPFVQPPGDSLQVVLEPVRHKDRLAVGGFDEILQHIQLAVVYLKHTLVLSVDGSVCHLGEFIRKSRSVPGVDFFAFQRDNQVFLHGIVGCPLSFG